jgi:hypothetical protein
VLEPVVLLGVAFAAEVTGGGSTGDFEIPFVDGKLQIPALDHEPMHWSGGHDSADFALEFFQGGHGERAFSGSWRFVVLHLLKTMAWRANPVPTGNAQSTFGYLWMGGVSGILP